MLHPHQDSVSIVNDVYVNTASANVNHAAKRSVQTAQLSGKVVRFGTETQCLSKAYMLSCYHWLNFPEI